MRRLNEEYRESRIQYWQQTKKVKSGEIRLAKSNNPLFMAVQTGNIEKAKELLANGADINVRDEDGLTPLMIACQCRFDASYDAMCDLLLESGADCNARDKAGWSPLRYACAHNGPISELLEWGANVNARDEKGQTVLMMVAAWDQIELIPPLLSFGADPAVETNDGQTVWDFASDWFAAGMIFHLWAPDVNWRDSHGETLLMKAGRKLWPDFAQKLLKNGADVHLQNDGRETALTLACRRIEHPICFPGQRQIVELLLEYGADPNQGLKGKSAYLSYLNRIALREAVGNGDKEAAKQLLDMGTPPDEVTDERGYTPLMLASKMGDKESVHLLLKAGAQVDLEATQSQLTPLAVACSIGHTEVVKLLLDAGADVNCHVGDWKDRWNSTPLIEASRNGHDLVVKLLLDAGATVNDQGIWNETWAVTALSRAAKNGHLAVAKLLLDAGACVDDGASLVTAAAYGQLDLVKLLVEHGAEINSLGVYREDTTTPLISAAEYDHDHVVQYLLERGADAEMTNEYGVTALVAARRRNHKQTVRILKRAIAKSAKTHRLEENSAC